MCNLPWILNLEVNLANEQYSAKQFLSIKLIKPSTKFFSTNSYISKHVCFKFAVYLSSPLSFYQFFSHSINQESHVALSNNMHNVTLADNVARLLIVFKSKSWILN